MIRYALYDPMDKRYYPSHWRSRRKDLEEYRERMIQMYLSFGRENRPAVVRKYDYEVARFKRLEIVKLEIKRVP